MTRGLHQGRDRIGPRLRVLPVFDACYHGYYLAGLAELLGWRALHPSLQSFPAFDRTGLAFIVEDTGARVYVDADDTPTFDRAALRWCDVYGKVNLDQPPVSCPEGALVLGLGPSMGIRVARLLSWLPACSMASLRYQGGERSSTELLRRWWMMWHRQPLSAYRPGDRVEPGYLYFQSSVWAPADRCNGQRVAFLRAARQVPGLRVEGGFAPPQRQDVPECRTHAVGQRHSHPQYLRRVRRSVFAFNTPAVLDCLGWRLPEYLALGKAVLSTPVLRALPAPLEHGRHLHVVAAEPAALRAGIERLCRDDAYRQHLGREGRRYYDAWLAPRAVAARLLDAAGVPAVSEA